MDIKWIPNIILDDIWIQSTLYRTDVNPPPGNDIIIVILNIEYKISFLTSWWTVVHVKGIYRGPLVPPSRHHETIMWRKTSPNSRHFNFPPLLSAIHCSLVLLPWMVRTYFCLLLVVIQLKIWKERAFARFNKFHLSNIYELKENR